MATKRFFTVLLAILLVIFGVIVEAVPVWAGAKERVLHSFNLHDGANPSDGLIFDASGNLYGTTGGGGAFGYGTVFRLTPGASGGWTEKVLYSFTGGDDGAIPHSDLIFDGAGNLYGTTTFGGAFFCEGGGCGTVFKLVSDANGNWTEEVLHSFNGFYGNSKDGWQPTADLLFDAKGNLYGTTGYGGAFGSNCGGWGCGTVFMLTPDTKGKWTETILYDFCPTWPTCPDGYNPQAGLVFDASGNLYGTTARGGANYGNCNGIGGCGTVFQLTPSANGKWTEAALHAFIGNDGARPLARVVFDSAQKNLFGTTVLGGNAGCNPPYGCGTVFELAPGQDGSWTEEVLHSFYAPYKYAVSNLIFDTAGNLYGTTQAGGTSDSGILFKLSPGTDGKWTESVPYSFGGKAGRFPSSSLIFDAAGILYGTAFDGGTHDVGLVFEITP
jgi:uncharacterized repeat protein (TIGR03803 family)